MLEAAGHRPSRRAARPAGLTRREAEVLLHITQGLSNREIAWALWIPRRRCAITSSTSMPRSGLEPNRGQLVRDTARPDRQRASLRHVPAAWSAPEWFGVRGGCLMRRRGIEATICHVLAPVGTKQPCGSGVASQWRYVRWRGGRPVRLANGALVRAVGQGAHRRPRVAAQSKTRIPLPALSTAMQAMQQPVRRPHRPAICRCRIPPIP